MKLKDFLEWVEANTKPDEDIMLRVNIGKGGNWDEIYHIVGVEEDTSFDIAHEDGNVILETTVSVQSYVE